MSDMWKILRQNIERTRPKQSNHQDISSFLRGEEENSYAKRQEEGKIRKPSVEEPLDVQIGEEKDKTDYLREFPKLQMKELNNMKENQQVKQLKQEYNRLYDRMLEMNDQIGKHEKEIMDLQMNKRANEKEVQRMKTLIRSIVYMFPGGSNVKSVIDTSGWKTEDVENDIITLITEVLARIKNVDSIIQQETKNVSDENKLLKQEVVRLQSQVLRIEELEKYILAMQEQHQSQPAPAPQAPARPEPEPEPQTPSEPKPFVTPFIFPKDETPAVPDAPKPAEKLPVFPVPPISEESKEAEHPKPFSFNPPQPAADPSPVDEDDGDDLVLMNVEGYIEALNDESRFVLKIIGEFGFSRNNELKIYLEQNPEGQALFTRGNKFSYPEMSQVVKHLRDTQLLDSEQVKLGGRGGGSNFIVFELSKLGKAVYKKMSGKKPVVSEKKLITNQHASVEHGYLIKDSAALFQEIGYNVLMDRDDVSIKLANGQRKDFDMILEKDGVKKYIEVERGTHSKDDFFEAMNKIKEVTNEFYFVCPNEQVKFGKTKRMFFQWITEELGGIDKAKGLAVNFTTYEALKDKKKQKNPWETTLLG